MSNFSAFSSRLIRQMSRAFVLSVKFLQWTNRLPGIHRPPEHMPQNRNLLLLDLLERVVLVRVLVTVEAAQAEPSRDAVNLLHAKLAIVIDGVHLAVDDIA